MSSDVKLVNVTKRFGDQIAVDDISFSVPAGSFFSLLGPSGCGKSTTLRMLSGFEYMDQGELFIAGKEVSSVPPYLRPTNMVFQRWALFPHMTVKDNVAFGLEVDRVAKPEIEKRVMEMLDLVGLTDFVHRKPGQLSGGQMQRVALARALVKRPAVLLLDEPLGALDLKLRNQMQVELKRIQQEIGTTFIYVTHDQGEALTMSDQIAVMNGGRIEQIGTPTEIYDEPQSCFVADFIGSTNLIAVDVLSAPDSRGLCQVKVGDWTFEAALIEQENQSGGSPKSSHQSGHVSIRHEHVEIGAKLQKSHTQVKGTIRDVVYHGAYIEYALSLEHALFDINLQVVKSKSSEIYEKGQDLTIGWEKSAARLYYDDPDKLPS